MARRWSGDQDVHTGGGVVVISVVAALIGAACASNDALEETRQELAQTRSDLAQVRQDLIAAIQTLQTDLSGDISTLRGGLSTAQGNITTLKGDLELRAEAIQGNSTVYVPYDGMNLLKFPVCTASDAHSGCPADNALYGEIGWFTAWPEMQWCVNRNIGPTGNEPPTVQTPEYPSLCLAMRGAEGDILQYYEPPGWKGLGNFTRLSEEGLIVGIRQSDVSSVGEGAVYAGIRAIGDNAAIVGDFYIAQAEDLPYNLFVARSPNGTFQWAMRLGTAGEAILRTAQGIDALKVEQNGSASVADGAGGWRQL